MLHYSPITTVYPVCSGVVRNCSVLRGLRLYRLDCLAVYLASYRRSLGEKYTSEMLGTEFRSLFGAFIGGLISNGCWTEI